MSPLFIFYIDIYASIYNFITNIFYFLSIGTKFAHIKIDIKKKEPAIWADSYVNLGCLGRLVTRWDVM